MRVEVFQPYHVHLMQAQGVQGAQLREVSHLPAAFERPPGPALTAFDGDRIILCGGIVRTSLERGTCWALLSQTSAPHMAWLHYATKRFIATERWRRLEASVEEGFGQGCRWVELLGFEFEGRMKGYGLNGETHLRYAKVI